MSSSDIKIVIKSDDQTARGFESATGHANKFEQQINRIGSGLRGLGTAAGLYSVIGSLKQAVEFGAKFEQTTFQMGQTFQGRTAEMIRNAKTLSESFNHYFDFTEVSYAFTKSADSMERYGITGEQYLQLVTRAADVAASKNLELKESIDRIESAMRGEAEASEYLGLTLNDTFMKTKAFNGALRGQWEKMDDNSKAWYRWHELMKQSEKYQGAAKEATETLTGSMKSLGGTIRDNTGPALESLSHSLAGVVNGMHAAIQEGGFLMQMAQNLNTMHGINEGLDTTQGSSFVRKPIPKLAIPSFTGSVPPPPPGGIKFLDDAPKKLKAAKKAVDEVAEAAKNLVESMRTPNQIYADELTRYETFLDRKLISTEQFTKAVETLQKEQFQAITMPELELKQMALRFEQMGDLRGTPLGGDVGIMSGGTFNEVASKKWQDHADSLDKTKDKYADLQRAIEGFGQQSAAAIADFAMGAKGSFADLANSIISDLSRMLIYQTFTKPAFDWIIKALPFPKAHTGWNVGEPAPSMKNVNPLVFAGAPRLHGGLAADEFPAILQRGETVIPKGAKTGGNVYISAPVAVTAPAGGSIDPSSAQMMGAEISKALKAELKRALSEEMRPGGMFNRGR